MFTEVDEESQSSLSRGPSSFIPGQPNTPSSLSTLSGTNGTDGASSAELRIISKGRRMWNGQSHEYSQTQVPYISHCVSHLGLTGRFITLLIPLSLSVSPPGCSARPSSSSWHGKRTLTNWLTGWLFIQNGEKINLSGKTGTTFDESLGCASGVLRKQHTYVLVVPKLAWQS